MSVCWVLYVLQEVVMRTVRYNIWRAFCLLLMVWFGGHRCYTHEYVTPISIWFIFVDSFFNGRCIILSANFSLSLFVEIYLPKEWLLFFNQIKFSYIVHVEKLIFNILFYIFMSFYKIFIFLKFWNYFLFIWRISCISSTINAGFLNITVRKIFPIYIYFIIHICFS